MTSTWSPVQRLPRSVTHPRGRVKDYRHRQAALSTSGWGGAVARRALSIAGCSSRVVPPPLLSSRAKRGIYPFRQPEIPRFARNDTYPEECALLGAHWCAPAPDARGPSTQVGAAGPSAGRRPSPTRGPLCLLPQGADGPVRPYGRAWGRALLNRGVTRCHVSRAKAPGSHALTRPPTCDRLDCTFYLATGTATPAVPRSPHLREAVAYEF